MRLFANAAMLAAPALLFSLAIPVAMAKEPTTAPAVRLEKPGIVTTEWLAGRLGDKELRIVDARTGLGPYLQGHVPGAAYLNTESLRISRGGVPGQLLSTERIAEIFGALDIGVDDEIVVYSGFEDSFSASTYIATVLRYLGAKRVGVLDGGFEKWELEQRPVTKAFPKLGAVAFRVTVDKDLLIDATQLQGAMKADEAVVLDARSAEQFAAGHIPGALNLSMRSLIGADKGMPWRDSGEIRATAAAAGLKPGKPVVTYCNSGREASQLAFTLQHVLGFDNVKVYDGSMVDWTARDLPRETTPKP